MGVYIDSRANTRRTRCLYIARTEFGENFELVDVTRLRRPRGSFGRQFEVRYGVFRVKRRTSAYVFYFYFLVRQTIRRSV